MLLESITVHIPAQEERDADIGEHGVIGTRCRAQFGAAAIEAGTPDYGENDFPDDASDAIANVLHCLDINGYSNEVGRVLERARENYEAEASGDV